MAIGHKYSEFGQTYLDSDCGFCIIEKILRKHESVYVSDKYLEVITDTTEKNNVNDMTYYFRFQFPGKLKLIIQQEKIKEKSSFRYGIVKDKIYEYSSHLNKETYDLSKKLACFVEMFP